MLADLNPPQREAVTTLSGPLLVLAGAGTGKTRVVTYRIAELIRRGTRPSRILAVTFTNKAAAEMQERATALLGRKNAEKPEISTFHSLCVRVLRRHIRELGYPAQFAIYDRGDQESMARSALREIKAGSDVLRPGDLLAIFSRWKMHGVRPPDAAAHAETDKEHLAASAYRRYQRALKAAGAVDFDDLLLLTEELLGRFPQVREQEAGRLSHLLVDEYQDTNGSQYRIVKALADGHRNLCVVGDDDQSIYGWRGAEVAHILRFQRDWPEAKIVRLQDNYRSTPQILAYANRLIVFNRERHEKVLRAARPDGPKPRILQLPDETTEARQVVNEIQSQLGAKLANCRDFAILFRTNEQPRPFEMELRRAKLPYTLIGGMSFYDRKEVRDLLAYLKVLAQPRDEVSLLRIINTPARGIGQAAVEALLAQAVASGKPVWEIMAAEDRPPMSSAVAASVDRFRALIEKHRRRLSESALVTVLSDLIAEIGYQQELARLYKDPNEQTARWTAVEEVVNSVGSYEQRAKSPTLTGYLEETALINREDDRDKESKLERDAIALMTLHSAKGLEFPHVYLVGMEEGILPHHRSVAVDGPAIDEERRLCYVGITRAQETLTMTLALGRLKWGKVRPTQPSRFLFELTGKADNPHRLKLPQSTPSSARKPHASKRYSRTSQPPPKNGKSTRAATRRPPKRG
jgi:DNA helicase-2/ATP-dependent DNA helicase PcrA